jgi:hypothetical protein
MKQTIGENSEKTVERIVRNIRNEPVPERIVELARELQAALDERNAKPDRN